MTTLHNVTPLFKLRKTSQGSGRRTTWDQQQRPVCTKAILKSWQRSSVDKMLVMQPDRLSAVPSSHSEGREPKVVLYLDTHCGMFVPVLHMYARARTCVSAHPPPTLSLSYRHIHTHNTFFKVLFKNIYTQNYTTTCTTNLVILRIILSGYILRRKATKNSKIKRKLSKIKWIIHHNSNGKLKNWDGIQVSLFSSNEVSLPSQLPSNWDSLMLQTNGSVDSSQVPAVIVTYVYNSKPFITMLLSSWVLAKNKNYFRYFRKNFLILWLLMAALLQG